MKITARVFKNENKDGKILAHASICIDEKLVINNFTIFNGKNGMFVSFPSQKGRDGEYRNIAYSLDNEFKEKLQNLIIKTYEENENKF